LGVDFLHEGMDFLKESNVKPWIIGFLGGLFLPRCMERTTALVGRDGDTILKDCWYGTILDFSPFMGLHEGVVSPLRDGAIRMMGT
jgi:hypothetical protein